MVKCVYETKTTVIINLSFWLFQLLNMYFTFVNTRGDNKNIISVSVSVSIICLITDGHVTVKNGLEL